MSRMDYVDWQEASDSLSSIAEHCDQRMRYVPCEHCGGTGEIVCGRPGEPWDDYAVLCRACEGYGTECVETEPVTMGDLD